MLTFGVFRKTGIEVFKFSLSIFSFQMFFADHIFFYDFNKMNFLTNSKTYSHSIGFIIFKIWVKFNKQGQWTEILAGAPGDSFLETLCFFLPWELFPQLSSPLFYVTF